jgi:hypothetical protein
MPYKNTLETILARTEKPAREEGCWLWTGCRGEGYGRVYYGGKLRRVHIVVYELLVGFLKAGEQLHHCCENKECCNPRHLERLTLKDHLGRHVNLAARNRAKTHCPQGHEYTEDNLVPCLLKKGKRLCLTCHREKGRAWSRRRPRKGRA